MSTTFRWELSIDSFPPYSDGRPKDNRNQRDFSFVYHHDFFFFQAFFFSLSLSLSTSYRFYFSRAPQVSLTAREKATVNSRVPCACPQPRLWLIFLGRGGSRGCPNVIYHPPQTTRPIIEKYIQEKRSITEDTIEERGSPNTQKTLWTFFSLFQREESIWHSIATAVFRTKIKFFFPFSATRNLKLWSFWNTGNT